MTNVYLIKDDCKSVAKAFIKLGLKRFHGVGILGFNAPEWHIRYRESFIRCLVNLKIIYSDLSLIEWHVLFTTISLKPLFDQGFCKYIHLYCGKLRVKNRVSVHCTIARSVQ